MANYREQKVTNEIKRLLGAMISREISDPAVPSMCSIISIKVSKDLKNAKVDISFIEKDIDIEKAIKALNHAAGFLRHRLSEEMSTRTVPELKFVYNKSIEHSIRINELLNKN
jgi:ribosome-binding factor A